MWLEIYGSLRKVIVTFSRSSDFFPLAILSLNVTNSDFFACYFEFVFQRFFLSILEFIFCNSDFFPSQI